MTHLPHLAARIVGTPLMVAPARLKAILAVVGGRIGIEGTGIVPEVPASVDRRGPVVTPNGIAILPLHGTFAKRAGAIEAASGLVSYAAIEEMVLDAATDPAVRAILLDIDSPGGEVGGVFDLAATIRQVGGLKPVWALADDAFSAAYLLASAAQRLFLPQTAGAGSVGVIAVHLDESQRDAHEGRRYTTVFAGQHKNDFSSHEPLSDSARARLQAEVDRLYGMFVATVAQHRGLPEAAVRATEAGLYFGGGAVAAGLADQVGTLREVLAELTAHLDAPRRFSLPSGSSFSAPNNQLAALLPETHSFMEADMPDLPTPQGPEAQAADHATSLHGGVPNHPTHTAQVIDLEQVRAEKTAQLRQEAEAIVELCALAGHPDLAGGFIAKGLGMEQVRRELLARRASGPEIHSQLMPGDGTHLHAATSLEANPVVTACQRLARQHTLGGG